MRDDTDRFQIAVRSADPVDPRVQFALAEFEAIRRFIELDAKRIHELQVLTLAAIGLIFYVIFDLQKDADGIRLLTLRVCLFVGLVVSMTAWVRGASYQRSIRAHDCYLTDELEPFIRGDRPKARIGFATFWYDIRTRDIVDGRMAKSNSENWLSRWAHSGPWLAALFTVLLPLIGSLFPDFIGLFIKLAP